MDMNKIIGIFFAIIWILIYSAGAQEIEQYSLLKLDLVNSEQIKELKILGLTLDYGPVVDNQVRVIVNRAELRMLENSNLKYEIEIKDMIAHYEANKIMSPVELHRLQQEVDQQFALDGFEFGDMGGYYIYDEVVSELDSMRLLYPDLITEKVSLGSSIEGREIWHVKISDNADVDEDEPEILYTALHHAREPQSMATVIYFMYYLLENYGKDPRVDYIVDHRELHFIPVVNPDGYVYNQSTNPDGGGLWRKNRRDNGNNIYGVDLNRNYGFQWGYDDIGSSADPSSNEYRGTEPFSEPETGIVRDFCENHQIQLCLNYHSFGNKLIYPWTYINQPNPDVSLYHELAESMTAINDYLYGTGYETLRYIFNGSATDWMYGEQTTKNKIISMTPEVGPSFWPDPSQIYPLADENIQSNIILAIGTGIISTDNNPQVQSISAELKPTVEGNDSILVTASISNPQEIELVVQAFVDNASHSYLDTMYLYDDGTRGDIVSGDHVYCRTIPEPSIEDIFNLHAYLEGPDGETHFLSAMNIFSTVGPIVYAGWSPFIIEDSIPNPGDILGFKLHLKNNSRETRIDDVEARLYSNDSRITVNNFYSTFGDIVAGATVESNQGYSIQISSEFTQDTTIYLPIAISTSEEYHAWNDSMQVDIFVTDLSDDDRRLPTTFALEQNYPNPFNPTTAIGYQLSALSQVELSIYNLLGQKVANLVSEKQAAGYHTVEWDASGFASGVYYYQIEAGEFHDVRKMILLQ